MHSDLAAHQFHQFAGNAESEPGSGEPPRDRGVGLFEGGEQPRLGLGADADSAVAHFEANSGPVRLARRCGYGDRHTDALGELDRIGDEIQQDSPQTVGRSPERAARVGVEAGAQFDAFRARRGLEQLDDFFDQRRQVEYCVFERDLAGLQFGDVENIFAEMQQRLRGVADRLNHLLLMSRQIGFRQQGVHA